MIIRHVTKIGGKIEIRIYTFIMYYELRTRLEFQIQMEMFDIRIMKIYDI